MAKIIILGAGLTGLSAAYHLEKKGFFDYQLFEKEDEVGGLCRSVYQDGFTFDYTGHLLHVSDEHFAQIINNVIGKENLNSINRRSFIFSHDVYTHYPFQINLYGLPHDIIAECIEGFIKKPNSKKDPKSFYQWAINNFGIGFAKYFFIPFQNKIFDYDIKKISPAWTGRFVPQTSLKQIITGALQEPQPSNIGYNSQFFYPKKGGIYFWIKKLAGEIKNKIHTNFCVESIDLKNKIVKFSNGHHEYFDQLINTIPLDLTLDILNEKSSSSLKKVSKKLICNSVVNFNLGISRSNLSDKHWIYFPEEKFPFYRMGFPHNFSENLVPKNHSSIYGEFSYINKNEDYILQTLNKSIEQAKNLLKIENKEIVTQKIIKIDRAYVIYDFWRQKNLENLHKELQANSLYSIGRYGEWKYSSMQEAVLDGKKIADKLIIDSDKLIIPAKKATDFDIKNIKIKHEQIQNG